jgi:hypothetical protein
MVEAFHVEELAVKGVVRLIQHRTHRRHLGVFEHRIPARLFVFHPGPHALTVCLTFGGADVVDKAAESLPERHHP